MNPIGAVFGALKYMPASVARKALEKVNPGFGRYFSKSIAYGVDANRALDYLTDRFESDAQQEHKSQLNRGAANNTLRPDEMVSRSQMSNAELPGKVLKSGLSLAAGAGLGSLGDGTQSQEAPQGQSAQPEEAIQQQNPLANYPELQAIIKQGAEGGLSADTIYRTCMSMGPSIKKQVQALEKESKMSFKDLLSQLLGGQSQAALQQEQPQPAQSAQPQQSNGQAALAEALQAYMKLKAR